MEAALDVKTADGVMVTRTFHPGTGKRRPLVIFCMDGLGVREALVGMARRIASNGYYVALPDLFYRSAPVAPFDAATTFINPPERERAMSLIRSVTAQRAMADLAALLQELKNDPAVDCDQAGAVGYCMGGGVAIAAAGTFPDRIRAAASYHGGRLATDAPDSPHLIAARARGRLYIGYAENDGSFPAAQCERLEKALAEAGVAYTVELYRAAHGFAVPDFPTFDEKAAQRHWETMLSLFRDTLGGGQ